MRGIHIPLLLALLFAMRPALADERKAAQEVPITFDENGLPIVSVTLHSLDRPDVARTFRFVLDTGAGWCVIDRSVPPAFFWKDPNTQSAAKDSAHQIMAAPSVLLKRVEVGGLLRDGIVALRMDLRNQMGRVQDHPVDGILGMSYLRGTRFLLDPTRPRLVWWATHTGPGLALPIVDGPGGVFYATLRLGKREAQAMLDTGMSGGVELPSNLRPKGGGEAMVSGGLSGARVSGTQMMVDRLQAGDGAWIHLPVTFPSEGKAGSIGSEVWFAAPVCFDFISDLVTLSLDPEGHLPIRREPTRNLPILWDRSATRPQLVVALVKPGSAMEKAGCEAGDVLIQVGALRGPALTRRAVQDLVASGVPHTWLVRRHGSEVRLAFGTR